MMSGVLIIDFVSCMCVWLFLQKDLVGQRGLLPNTEQQTFVMTLPRKLRLKYEEVLLTVALEVSTNHLCRYEKLLLPAQTT